MYDYNYWSVVVSVAPSCTIFELFGVENIMTLKSRLRVTQGHCKWQCC